MEKFGDQPVFSFLWLGFGPQQGVPGARPMAPVTGPRPPRPPVQFPRADGDVKSGQRDLGVPVLGDSFLSQNGMDQADSNVQEATAAEKKAYLLILIYLLFILILP